MHIDNMLIVTPPNSQKLKSQEETVKPSANILDFNRLDVDFLSDEYLDAMKLI
jgi:hypothetical protein